jgi:integrase
VNILLSHPELEYRSFMMVALYTGCRRNEILGLEWQDVDLTRRQIVIRGEIGKMGKRRTIPMNDVLHEMFVKWPSERQGLLFPNYKSDSVSQKFRRWVRQLGLPREIHLYSLRATFACHFIEKGVDIYVVPRLLGHSSVKVTEKHYVSLDPRHVQSAVNQLDFGIGGSG